MAWTIEISQTAIKQMKKLDKVAQKRIVAFLREKIESADNPRANGKALKGPKGEFWRYRVGPYRLICQIKDRVVTVCVLNIGHRKDVYR